MNQDFKKLCGEYLEYCRFEKGLSENSLRAYAYDLSGLAAYKEANCEDAGRGIAGELLEKQFWHRYLTELAFSRSARTVKRKEACFTGFFHFLREKEIVSENPFEKFCFKLKVTRTVPETLSLNEIKRILTAAYRLDPREAAGMTAAMASYVRLRDIAVLELLFATGMRVHELCGLTFAAYSAERGTIRVLGKGGKERMLYLANSDVQKALARYLDSRGRNRFSGEKIFLNRMGRPLSCQAVREIVSKYCRRAGIDRRITPHSFRHTFASMLLEEGVELRYIQEFLGHSSITTTQIYLHTSEKRKREILAELHPRKKIAKTIK